MHVQVFQEFLLVWILSYVINFLLYFHRCRFCTSGHENALGLKNHVLNHFKDQLNQHLPSCAPFLCPECKNPNRDKITILRHYAFGHKKVFDLVDQEDFKPREKDHPIKNVPTGGKIKTGALILFWSRLFWSFNFTNTA